MKNKHSKIIILTIFSGVLLIGLWIFLVLALLNNSQSSSSLNESSSTTGNSSSSSSPNVISVNLRNYGVDGSNMGKLTQVSLYLDGVQLANQSVNSALIQKGNTYLLLRTDGEETPNMFEKIPNTEVLSDTHLSEVAYRISVPDFVDPVFAKRFNLSGDYYFYVSRYELIGEDNPLRNTGTVAVSGFNFNIDQGDLDSLLNISCITQESTPKTCDDLVKNLQVTLAAEELQDFGGEFVTAVEPEGWNIKEYNDVTGMSSTTGTPDHKTTYSGLTKLEIIDPNGNSVFRIAGKDGVGYLNICDDIYKFADTDSEYIDQMLGASININQKEANVVNLSDLAYSEFTFFDIYFRRVGDKFYYNTNESPASFNPSCGSTEFIIGFNDNSVSPYYLMNQEDAGRLYDWKYDLTKLTEEQVMQLEEILFSVRLK